MNEPTRTLLYDLAIASACGLAVGVFVAAASVPALKWWHDRGQDRRSGQSAPTPFPGALPVVDGGQEGTHALLPASVVGGGDLTPTASPEHESRSAVTSPPEFWPPPTPEDTSGPFDRLIG